MDATEALLGVWTPRGLQGSTPEPARCSPSRAVAQAFKCCPLEKTTKHLQIQKHNHQLELIIKECILNTIRESIPIEHLLKVYMEDQFIEEDTEVVDTEEIISQDPVIEEQEQQEHERQQQQELEQQQELDQLADKYEETGSGVKQQTIKFDDIDRVRTLNDSEGEELINAPSTENRL